MHVCTDIRTTDNAKVGVCTHCYTMLCSKQLCPYGRAFRHCTLSQAA